MNKQRTNLLLGTLLILSLSSSAMVSSCSSSGDKAVSGRSIFETPTASIFDEPKTRTPLPRETAVSEATRAPDSTPAPVATTPPSKPPPPPTSPPPPKPTPVPATPTPPPAPEFFTLNLKVTNPDYGKITIDPAAPGNRYEKGTTVSLYALPNADSKFDGWSGDASGSSNSVFVTLESNKTVQVGFSRLNFALTANAGAGGSISLSPDGKSFDSGTKVTVRAVPQQGFTFKSWSGDAFGSENPITVTIDREKRVAAEFIKAEYRLNTKVDPVGFIDATPAGPQYDGGTVVTLTARPSDKYRFVGWQGDATGNSPTITVTMDSNKNVTAKFIRTFNLLVLVQPSGAGSVTPSSGTFDENTEVTITVTPASNYELIEWGGAGGLAGNSLTITIVMNWDKNLIADFRQVR